MGKGNGVWWTGGGDFVCCSVGAAGALLFSDFFFLAFERGREGTDLLSISLSPEKYSTNELLHNSNNASLYVIVN
jgi:hypothetical protein